jgi:hypothetical protein
MKRLLILPVLLLTLLVGTPAFSADEGAEKHYDTVLEGGLGISFSDTVEVITGLGFLEMRTPPNVTRVGEWIKFGGKDDFFSQIVVMIAPISRYIYRIEGFRSNSGENAFSECRKDQVAIQSQIKKKYPALHENYHNIFNDLSKRKFSFSYHEGRVMKGWNRGSYVGRAVSMECHAFAEGGFFRLRYTEADEKKKGVFKEQEKVFEGLSGDVLKNKGLNPNQL